TTSQIKTMEKILRILKKLLPRRVFNLLQAPYHYSLALVGSIIYRFPSRKIKIIGVTGTKGKTSTTEILAAILETAGFKIATTSTLQFKVDDKITRNLYKMSMPGRMFMQKFLRRAINARCDFAVLEVTSEGTKLFRHKFIDLDGLVFTNISPEHIESHGSYAKYLDAKLEYARALNNSPKPNKILVINAEDKESAKFANLAPKAKIIRFNLADAEAYPPTVLPGKFNLYNITAAAKMAEALGVKKEIIDEALKNLKTIPGRMEQVLSDNPKQNFEVIVDYAHTADSLTKAYEALGTKRKICVLGNTGGGRDKWKRPQMGKVANDFCDEIILTNEDPYDEDPEQIVKDMTPQIIKPYKIMMDRRTAINSAICLASAGDVVIITGKGTDPFIMEANGQRTPWSDYDVAREEILKVLVETLKRELGKALVGRKIKSAKVLWPKTVAPLSVRVFEQEIVDKKIKSVNRQAKILIIDFTDSTALAIHLKMTGQLIYCPKTPFGQPVAGGHPDDQMTEKQPSKHTRIIFEFTDGSHLYFNDLRKFGWVRLVDDSQLKDLTKHIGLEPLSKIFTDRALIDIFKRYPNRTIKQILLDQTLIAGIGNIYADESCFLSKLLPTRKSSTLKPAQIKTLREKIIAVLKLSIQKKGTSSRNYRRSDGSRGGFVPHLNVYGRAGLPCKVCGRPIQKIRHLGRGTHFCKK
ncbi:MAG: DNA-formamidopyrimidine glycosylase, partial [Candidatus Vogelbacteria bacterium]|nr:DNA-formamidopyrimidine glycosylase [Candidatus Vogelbacteria bacterium]